MLPAVEMFFMCRKCHNFEPDREVVRVDGEYFETRNRALDSDS